MRCVVGVRLLATSHVFSLRLILRLPCAGICAARSVEMVFGSLGVVLGASTKPTAASLSRSFVPIPVTRRASCLNHLANAMPAFNIVFDLRSYKLGANIPHGRYESFEKTASFSTLSGRSSRHWPSASND
jgi:hypothetical protein